VLSFSLLLNRGRGYERVLIRQLLEWWRKGEAESSTKRPPHALLDDADTEQIHLLTSFGFSVSGEYVTLEGESRDYASL